MPNLAKEVVDSEELDLQRVLSAGMILNSLMGHQDEAIDVCMTCNREKRLASIDILDHPGFADVADNQFSFEKSLSFEPCTQVIKQHPTLSADEVHDLVSQSIREGVSPEAYYMRW